MPFSETSKRVRRAISDTVSDRSRVGTEDDGIVGLEGGAEGVPLDGYVEPSEVCGLGVEN